MYAQVEKSKANKNRAVATKIKRSSAAPIQRAIYMRALYSDNRVASEIESLKRIFINETTRQHQVNTWVDGFAGMPTARNNGNDKHYYSPVGYSLETKDDADVWANYRGDGNTNDIPVTSPRWLTAAQVMRTAVLGVENYLAWADSLEDDPWRRIPEVNAETGTQERRDYINYYLKPYLLAPTTVGGQVIAGRAEGQQTVRNAITTAGLASLREHYNTRPNGTVGERFMGAGVNPNGMEGALANQDIRYIESILHARFSQVKSAWYNRDLGNYAAAVAQENWRAPTVTWLANRQHSAEAIRTAFNNAGANNINVEVIGPLAVNTNISIPVTSPSSTLPAQQQH